MRTPGVEGVQAREKRGMLEAEKRREEMKSRRIEEERRQPRLSREAGGSIEKGWAADLSYVKALRYFVPEVVFLSPSFCALY